MTWRRVVPAGAGWALALLATATILAGQSSAPTAGQIAGTIRGAADNAPIGRARVVAAAANAEPRVTLSGADGRFVLRDLPPAAYTIKVSRTGYAPYTHGEGRRAAALPITVSAGQSASVEIAMQPGRHLAGRILDEDGTPFAGAIVEALTVRVDGGRDTLVSVASGRTDDRGEFRLFGLAPGEYYVSAADPAFGSVATANGVLRYPPTYHPGVSAAGDAALVRVPESGDPPHIEFRLKLLPPSRVSGRVVAPGRRQLLSAAIVMTPVDDHGAPSASPDDPSILPDGRFTFGRVTPGRYQIRARGQSDPAETTAFAVFAIDVNGRDVEGLELPLRPGAVIEGALHVDGRHAPVPSLATLRVRAPSVDGNRFGDAVTGAVQPNGAFALRGVSKGAHQIVVDGLPAPWTLKQVLYRGLDVTDRAVDVSEGEKVNGVQVTVTDVTTVVEGVVRDNGGRPAPNVAVLVFSRTPLFWMPTNRRMRAAYTDREGRFAIAGLPPGRGRARRPRRRAR